MVGALAHCFLLTDVVLNVVLVSVDFAFEVLEVHLDFLLELDVAADGGLHLLRLRLEGLVAVDADEVVGQQLDEVPHQVVGQGLTATRHLLVLVQPRQLREVVLRWEHPLQGVEEQVLRLLQQFLGGALRRVEQILKLFQHLK